jgi:F-type H+-transporting ATPase subunit delta
VAGAASLTAGVAGRYATALFELAESAGTLDRLESDLDALETALAESADLRDLISSAIYTRDEQGRAMAALAERMDLTREMRGTLGVMALHRRLFVLPGTIRAVKGLIAEARGEVTAEVSAARALTDAQRDELLAALRERTGRDVKLAISIDESLIGGLVVRVGSQMIDSSIRTKLANLQTFMKEAG